MSKKPENYSRAELTQLDTDELLKLYNRTAERVNKQVTRLKNAGIYDDTAALYDVQRAPVYRTERAKNRALQNVEQLTEDILALQERGRGEITTTAASKEVIALKRDLIVMLKGSHIGKSQILKEDADKFWKSIKPEHLRAVKIARAHFKAVEEDKIFYEAQSRLKLDGNKDMPVFNNVNDVMAYLKKVVPGLKSEIDYHKAAPEIVKNMTKRF